MQYLLQIFQIKSLILSVFILVLKVFLKFIINVFYKNSRVVIIFIKKHLKFVSRIRNARPYFKCMPMLILSSASTDVVLKEKSHNQVAIIANNFSYVKIVFTLLTKMIAIEI